MTLAQQQRANTTQPPVKVKPPNAELATSIAVSFLRTLGNKHGVKPRKVSLHESVYAVELEIGKGKTAIVQVEAQTREIKEYEIKTKEKEESGLNLPLSPKLLMVIFGISAAVYLIFAFLNVSGMLFGH
jgi:hypothetical protein